MQPRPPAGPFELGMVATFLADAGDQQALAVLGELRAFEPIEADTILARLLFRQSRPEQAARALEAAFATYRKDPWPSRIIMLNALETTRNLARATPELGPRLFAAVRAPFAVYMLEEARFDTMVAIARVRQPAELCREALAPMEPHVPWRGDLLSWRMRCYRATGDPRAAHALADLDELLDETPFAFGDGLAD
jgi:hypothetical protein